MDDDASQVVEGFVAVVVMIGRNRLRNLLNTLSFHWDYYLMIKTMMLMTWFDSAVDVAVVVGGGDDWSLKIPHRFLRHVSVGHAAPIAMRNCIWFYMLNKRSCLVLQWREGKKKIVRNVCSSLRETVSPHRHHHPHENENQNQKNIQTNKKFLFQRRNAEAAVAVKIKNLSALRWS